MKAAVDIGLARVSGLPRAAYVEDNWYDRDLDRIFFAHWQAVGHSSQLPIAGSFITYDLGEQSLFVIRDEAARLHALHNVCRHRGARLIDEPSGTCHRRITCPYHGWAYHHDGALSGTSRMDGYVAKNEYPLHRAWVDEWNGIVFVCLADEQPPPVGVLLEGVDFSLYSLEAAKVALDREHIIQANWKIVWENALECYHCAINHPELKEIVQVVRDGPEPSDVQSGDFEYRPDYPILPGRASFTIDGALKSRRPLGTATRLALLQWHMCATELFACPDHAYVQIIRPLSATQTAFRVILLVHHDAVEGQDYDLAELTELQQITRGQDDSLCERVQRGVRSPAFTPGPLNPSYEYVLRRFDDLYLETIS